MKFDCQLDEISNHHGNSLQSCPGGIIRTRLTHVILLKVNPGDTILYVGDTILEAQESK